MTKAELNYCNWIFKKQEVESFYNYLFNAIVVADEESLEKLRKAFPDEVEIIFRCRYNREVQDELFLQFIKQGYKELQRQTC